MPEGDIATAAAPTPAAITTELPLAELHASKTNPRRHFDQAALEELAASIREHGVFQPIIARRHGNGYEIVAGERRYRASKIAGLTTVPVLVRELSDVQTLELQVIENLQRADLHPLEEAEGYEQLMKLHHQTVDELAAKVGKSRAYVYARLKLLALSAQSRKAFYAGELNPSTAILVARIPGKDLQEKAVKEITHKDYRGDIFSVRLAAEHIQRNYMLRLKEAPFSTKDPKLVAKAGACGDCPKRTGNQPELFADVGSADVCTDPACFSAKREAHYAIQRAEAKAKGQEVISGKDAKAIAPHGYVGHGYVGHGYVRTDEKSRYMNGTTIDVGAALKKLPDLPVTLLEMPSTHELVPIVEEKVLAAALRKAGIIKTSPRNSTATAPAKRAPEGPTKREIEDDIRWRIVDAIRSQLTQDASTIGVADGALIASILWQHLMDVVDGGAQRIATQYGWWKEGDSYQQLDAVHKRFAQLSAAELWRVMIDIALHRVVDGAYTDKTNQPEELYEAATRHGVDHAALRVEVATAIKAKAAEAKAAAKASAKKPAAKKPAKKSTKASA